jgi:hypothetical protein
MVGTNGIEEQFSFTAYVFTLQEVTITLWGNADEMPLYFNMPSNYTPDDGAKSDVIITLT